jgi:hypothetical protein
MQLDIEVWLRGTDSATTQAVEVAVGEPAAWTDADVRTLLEELLRAIDRQKNPDADPHRAVTLRGFNWIVSPFEGKGLLVSVEIQLGAAAAGPFAIAQAELESMITRVVAEARSGHPAPARSVH